MKRKTITIPQLSHVVFSTIGSLLTISHGLQIPCLLKQGLLNIFQQYAAESGASHFEGSKRPKEERRLGRNDWLAFNSANKPCYNRDDFYLPWFIWLFDISFQPYVSVCYCTGRISLVSDSSSEIKPLKTWFDCELSLLIPNSRY